MDFQVPSPMRGIFLPLLRVAVGTSDASAYLDARFLIRDSMFCGVIFTIRGRCWPFCFLSLRTLTASEMLAFSFASNLFSSTPRKSKNLTRPFSLPLASRVTWSSRDLNRAMQALSSAPSCAILSASAAADMLCPPASTLLSCAARAPRRKKRVTRFLAGVSTTPRGFTMGLAV